MLCAPVCVNLILGSGTIGEHCQCSTYSVGCTGVTIAMREPTETSSVNAARPSNRAIGLLSHYKAKAAPRG